MAKGDTFEVTSFSEIELSFQLNLKRADLAKRNDADRLTHVVIEFSPEPRGNAPPDGDIRFTPLLAGSPPDKFEILPIESDDPKFVRLYKVGTPVTFNGDPLDEMLVRVSAKLVPKDGQGPPTGLPNDSELCKLRVKRIKPPPRPAGA